MSNFDKNLIYITNSGKTENQFYLSASGRFNMPFTKEELEEFLRKDEDQIRSAVEFVRKHPVKLKPDLKNFLDWDLFRLHAMSYNRHNMNRERIKLDNDFIDKRFAEILGDDY